MTPQKDPLRPFRIHASFARGSLGNRNGETRALPRLAGDVELAAMAVDDVLDDGEPQARAALVPALHRRRPDRSARSGAAVLRRDAGTVILHGERDLRAPRPSGAVNRDIHLPPLSPYFTAFSIRFSAIRRSSSRSPSTRTGRAGSSGLMTTPRSFAMGERLSTIWGAIWRDRPVCVGDEVGAHLDARQGQQIVDQALHALRLALA